MNMHVQLERIPLTVYIKSPEGGHLVFFGWVCAARESKLALRSKKNFP